MAIPPLPSDIEQIGRRHFSFYPPILGFEHNDWLHGSTNWSEIQVINARTGTEAWIPRRFVGQVSSVEDPVLIVGLTRELEYREGSILPCRRRVIELPVAVNGSTVVSAPRAQLAPIVNIRLEGEGDAKKGRNLIVFAVLGAVACSVVMGVVRTSRVRPRPELALSRLSSLDTYSSIVRKLGVPATESELREAAGQSYWTLSYPNFKCNVILTGRLKDDARYLETLDLSGRVTHSRSPLPKQPDF